MSQVLTVVVTGSTGKQGSAGARSLLERGHKVLAVTRDPKSSQAKLLANAGATLVTASLEDTAATAAVLAELADLVAQGELDVPIAGAYPLDNVRDAFRQLELCHTRGKLVLRP